MPAQSRKHSALDLTFSVRFLVPLAAFGILRVQILYVDTYAPREGSHPRSISFELSVSRAC
jgi:hypothetical protein